MLLKNTGAINIVTERAESRCDPYGPITMRDTPEFDVRLDAMRDGIEIYVFGEFVDVDGKSGILDHLYEFCDFHLLGHIANGALIPYARNLISVELSRLVNSRALFLRSDGCWVFVASRARDLGITRRTYKAHGPVRAPEVEERFDGAEDFEDVD